MHEHEHEHEPAAHSGGTRRAGGNSFRRAGAAIPPLDCVGRRTARDKAHFFAIARGSATECAAALDLLLARALVAPAQHRHSRGLLVRVVQMLTRLIARQRSE